MQKEVEVKSQPDNLSDEIKSPNFALLIGIDEYSNLADRFQLGGCVNDVKLMNRLLIEKFQFAPQNIRVLIDKNATRQNIIDEFEGFLIKNAQEDGQALFYYSGHGSRMTDLNSDEPDAYDETIVPYNSRDKKKKVIDIPDDKLRELLWKLTQKCKNVTFILDCCHSGSGVRGQVAVPKQVPALELDQPKTRVEAIIEERASGFLPPDPNYVLISACKDNEYAYEYNGYGVLTYAFNDVVRKYPKATYREIMYKVCERVAFEHPSQHPQLEGKRRDATVFGDLGVVEKFVEVIKVEKDSVQLNAGTAHNVTTGSIYALYKPGTTSTVNNEKDYLGKVKITTVDPFTSWAKFEEKKESDLRNAAAFEIAHHYGDLQLAVRLDLKNNPEIQMKIEKIFKAYKSKKDLVKIVSPKERYDVNIRVDGDSLILERPDLTPLKKVGTDDNSITYQLTDILKKEARRLNIYRLENDKSKLRVEMLMERWEDVDDNLNPINKLEIEETEGGQKFLKVADVIKVTITNKSALSVYPYLLDLGSDGSVSLLFPAPGAQDSPLGKNQSIETDLMRITPPEGLNGLKLIATTVPTDFSVLTHEGYRGIDDTLSAKRGLDSPLGKLLNMAWGGKRNVDRIKPLQVKDWTTEMISFFIRDAFIL
jgi:hypothetical protein